MVVYEAASAIVNLPNCTAKELAPAVSGKWRGDSGPAVVTPADYPKKQGLRVVSGL